MDLGLKDRVAIIGGSSRGMGRAIALAFAQEGANVAICARTEADLRRTEIELARVGSQQHVLAIPADLAVARDIRRVVRDTFNRFGQIGILVTHMGYGPPGRPSEFSDETIMTALDENFLSSVRFAREVIPYMKQQRWGRIVHLLPSFRRNSSNNTALSAASQMALVGYSKMLANELAPFNITVNNLVAGPVETEFLASAMESEAQESGKALEDLKNNAVSAIPMGRLGRPEEVGDLVAFLGSDRASFLTGTSVLLDGGMLQGTP
ncbi:MAG: SDR family oxidoreductase [Chloroflexi bacterium]|nr:SDR family oxidoreductase [Chloroflexota bacterium]MDA1272405.1 SDR family oxidoreductase [Chloroflexota bacterium]